VTRTQLAGGVYLTYLPAKKFKTSLLSAQFVVHLRWETASANALFSAVLRRGTVSYPDMGLLSRYLDKLYGARIDTTIRKKGETQCVGFVASLIDDSAFVVVGQQEGDNDFYYDRILFRDDGDFLSDLVTVVKNQSLSVGKG